MNKNVIGLLLFMFLVGCCNYSDVNTPKDFSTSPQSVDYAMNATVKILNEEFNGSCTGVFITRNIVLTARHCVVGESTLEAIKQVVESGAFGSTQEAISAVYGKDRYAAIRYTDTIPRGEEREDNVLELRLAYVPLEDYQSRDVAIMVVVDTKDYSDYVIEIATKEVYPGQRVYSIGHPMGMDWIFRSGMIAQSYNTVGFWTDMHVAPGCSGGPAFNKQGQLVGIASKVNGDHDLGWYVTISSVLRTLKDSGLFGAN